MKYFSFGDYIYLNGFDENLKCYHEMFFSEKSINITIMTTRRLIRKNPNTYVKNVCLRYNYSLDEDEHSYCRDIVKC